MTGKWVVPVAIFGGTDKLTVTSEPRIADRTRSDDSKL
jgi:hypothetical protein